MASINALTSYASTLVSKKVLCSPLPLGLGPHSVMSPSKTPSRPFLVVKAQQGGGPMFAGNFHKKVALVDTSPYVRTPWSTSEDESEIRMWFDMPGLGVDNIEVDVIDDLLVIRGDGGIDAFGSKIMSPRETTIQLPFNSWKEEIIAVFKNGVLYITVPKIIKFERKVIHIPVRSVI